MCKGILEFCVLFLKFFCNPEIISRYFLKVFTYGEAEKFRVMDQG